MTSKGPCQPKAFYDSVTPFHRETEMTLLPGHLFSQNLWEVDHLWLSNATQLYQIQF